MKFGHWKIDSWSDENALCYYICVEFTHKRSTTFNPKMAALILQAII